MKARVLFSLALTLILLSGCAIHHAVVQQPIYVPEISVAAQGKKISSAKLKEIIIAACVRRGWNIDSATASNIQASMNHHGKESITIDIAYSPAKITITHKASSPNLKYEVKPTGPEIHRSYNRWVKNIEMDIRGAIAMAN